MTEPGKKKNVTIRMTPEEIQRAKDAYAATYHLHRLSWNAWIIRRLTEEESA